MERFPLTRPGYESLKEELRHLKQIERPEVIKAIEEARKHGDLSENAEYHAAREKQGFIEGRIKELEFKIGRAEIIDVSKLSGDTVKFGATVKIVDEDTDEEKTFQVVGEEESDITKGKLSVASPLAKALIGKKKGDSVEVKAPKGSRYYEILTIKFC